MTIKPLGGVFGRNPTFNDVTIEGQLTFDGDIDINSDLKVDGDLDVTGNSDLTGTLTVRSKQTMVASDLVFDNAYGVKGKLVAGSEVNMILRNASDQVAIDPDGYGAKIGFGSRYDFAGGGDFTVGIGNVVIGTSGKGIDFSATAGTGTSELLSDYEEGVWTPTYAITGGSFSSITYNAYTGGVYTKVGNVVYVSGYITTDSAVVSVDGGLTIEGLPFATGSGTGLSTRSAVTIGEVVAFGTNYPTSGRFQAGTSRIYVTERSSANGASTFLQASNMANTTVDNQISFSGFYMI
jgi:hypothetical protein